MTSQQPGTPWQGQQRVPPPPPPGATAAYPIVPGPQSWWARLSPGSRAALIIAAFVVPLFMLCGGVTAIGALTSGSDDPAAAPSPTASPTPAPSPSPVIEIRTVTETEEIPFEELIEEDSSLLEGTEEVRSEGATGEKTITYEETYTNGVRTNRKKVDEEVTSEPQDRVIVKGTGQPPPPPPPPPGGGDDGDDEDQGGCHPSYEGACVPFASDVDCAGGSGNGPAYVRGPVYVVGPDVYDLDRDGDGVACE